MGRGVRKSYPLARLLASGRRNAGTATGSGVPARTAIILPAELRRTAPRLPAEALATQPGMSLYDDLGSPYKPTLVFRQGGGGVLERFLTPGQRRALHVTLRRSFGAAEATEKGRARRASDQ